MALFSSGNEFEDNSETEDAFESLCNSLSIRDHKISFFSSIPEYINPFAPMWQLSKCLRLSPLVTIDRKTYNSS